MMFLIGGIPNIYHGKVVESLANRISRQNNFDRFVSSPLKPLAGGNYLIDQDYCTHLINKLVEHFSNDQSCLDRGLAVIMFSNGDKTNQIETRFFPFAFYLEAQIIVSDKNSDFQIEKIAKEYVQYITKCFEKIRKPLAALNNEFSDRLQRTPFLLPSRNFASEKHKTMLRTLVSKLSDSNNPSETIKSECISFQHSYPLKKLHDTIGRSSNERNNKYFEDDHGVWFASPGRALHGRRQNQVEAPHSQLCFLNSRLRLGGVYRDGFHYDCTKSGKVHKGNFCNCHNVNADYKGNPHLNIYPDDYIR
jgi:hypothetical protein